MDNCLQDTFGAIQRRLRLRWQLDIPRHRICYPSSVGGPTDNPEINKDILDQILHSQEFYEQMDFFPGVVPAMEVLRGCGPIIIITSRPQIMRGVTFERLVTHFGHILDDERGFPSALFVKSGMKAKHALAHGVKIAMDDDAVVASAYARKGIRCWHVTPDCRNQYVGGTHRQLIRRCISFPDAVRDYCAFFNQGTGRLAQVG